MDATGPADQLERVLGPTWEAMSFSDLHTRAHDLHAVGDVRAAEFTRQLIDYMMARRVLTAGEALAALTARQANEPHAQGRNA